MNGAALHAIFDVAAWLAAGLAGWWLTRLRGLQFRIDCQRQLAKNNMDSCIRIATMMHDSFYSMRCEMVQLNNPDYVEPLPEYKENNILYFSDYYRKKK